MMTLQDGGVVSMEIEETDKEGHIPQTPMDGTTPDHLLPPTRTPTAPMLPVIEQTPEHPSHTTPLQDPTPFTDKRHTDDALLDMINPSAQGVTDSHIERVAMEGAMSVPRDTGKKAPPKTATTSSSAEAYNKKSKSKSKKSSPSPLKQVERKLQKKLDREAKTQIH